MLVGPGKSYVVKEPLGVIAIIGSWNYPYMTVLAPLVSVIAAGNTAICKPSEQSPFSSKRLKFFFTRWLDKEAF
jgi:aldehyde dehydrogenase (NAD+)